MSFNKVSVVVLMLLVVATITEAAGPNYCSKCECKKDKYGVTKCSRYERKVGGCPLACGTPCACTRSIPPTCWCTKDVESCSPPQCSNNSLADVVNSNGN